MSYLAFGSYLPDLPDYQNPGVTVAKNVTPFGASYKQFPSLVNYSNALTASCKGAIKSRDSGGNAKNFAGDATKLYKLGSAAWSDVSKVGGYSTATDGRWEFTLFGSEIIATNFADTMQTFNIESSSVFADVTGTPPTARHIATVRDFLVVGNTNDVSDGSVPYRIRWPGVGTTNSWTVSATTQSNYKDLYGEGGWVQRIIGGEYGVIFQERSIWRMTYVGSPVIFQFDKIEDNKGTPAPGSVIKIGNYIAYLGIDGFYIFDGNQSIPIGFNQVDKTFYNEVDQNYLYNVSAAVDPTNQIIYWSYPATGNTGGRPNKILMYNYSANAEKRWSFAEQELELIFSYAAEGYTLDSLDTVSTNIDTLSPSLDSRFWTGSVSNLSAFTSSHKLASFTGTALDAAIETGEYQLNEGYRTVVNLVRPLVDGSSSTVSVQIGTRNTLAETVTWGMASSVQSDGDAPVRSEARYHRARVNISGGFTHAQGIEILESSATGTR